MTISVCVDRSASLLRSTFSGRLTLADFIEARDRTITQALPFATLRHLIDLRDVSHVDFDEGQLEELAQFPSVFAPGALQIVIAQEGTAVFGIVRMYQAAARQSGRNVHLVDDLAKAHALLGLS